MPALRTNPVRREGPFRTPRSLQPIQNIGFPNIGSHDFVLDRSTTLTYIPRLHNQRTRQS